MGVPPFWETPIYGFAEMGIPQNGWFIVENHGKYQSKMDDN